MLVIFFPFFGLASPYGRLCIKDICSACKAGELKEALGAGREEEEVFVFAPTPAGEDSGGK